MSELIILKDLIVNAGDKLNKLTPTLRRGDVSHKKLGETVTRLDKEINKYIIDQLQNQFPDDDIVNEESEMVDGNGTKRKWYVDPIDGTNNFVHHLPFYAISIGLRDEGGWALGAVYDPLRKDLYWAERGKGAHLGDKQISVSKIKTLEEAMVFEGHGYGEEMRNQHAPVINSINLEIPMRRDLGSAALMVCYVAEGKGDGFIVTGVKSWDCAAAALILEEAGGKVTNYAGNAWAPEDHTIIASNSLLHDKLLKLTRT